MDYLISMAAAIDAMRECWRRVNQFAKLFEANRIMDCIKAVKELHAVDAIPVEWLYEHDSEGNEYGRRYTTVVEALSMWQKEQEARSI